MRFIVSASSQVGHSRDRTELSSQQVEIALTPEQVAQIKRCVAETHQRLPGEIVTISVVLSDGAGKNMLGSFHSLDLNNWLTAMV
jgi:hypothetical protein